MARGRGNTVTALDGAYCPVPAPRTLELRLKKGRYVYTEIGLEMQCNTCGEYYPADTEFFFPMPGQGSGLHGYCKDCYLIKTGRSGGLDRKGRSRKLHSLNADLEAINP